MNTRRKARLRKLATELDPSKLAVQMAELETLATLEDRDALRHKKAGKTAYGQHARLCAGLIREVITILQHGDLDTASVLLLDTVETQPKLATHDTYPAATPKPAKKPSVCSRGECNHPEHL